MNRVALDLGFIQIYWYSITVLIAIIVGTWVVYAECKKQNMVLDDFTDLFFNTIVWGIVGARLYYVIFNFSYYWNNKLQILEVWNGGLAIHGGIIAGLLYVIHFSKKRNYNLLKIIDMMVVGLIIAQSIGRWGNFFNQEAYGPVVSLESLKKEMIPQFIIDRMRIYGEYHEPTFYYESLWSLNGFIILQLVRKNKKIKVGLLTGVYFVYYSLGRLFIESLRIDSLMLGKIKMAQLMSILLIIVGLLLIFKPKITKKSELYHDPTNTRGEDDNDFENLAHNLT